MKKLFFILLFSVVLGSGLFGSVLMNTMARESQTADVTAYYTSMKIEEGDSLWSIAQKYAPELELTTQEYVDRLRVMNHLKGDTIHTGRYLTIMYRGDTE